MKRIFQYIFIALTFSVMSFSLNSCRQKGVIDEDVLSQIYADMLMTDQWISSTAGVRLVADTSLVYEPILKKYGHTSADYRSSVEHYLKDPEDYADIMKGTVDILEKRLAELRKLKGEQMQDKERLDFIKKIAKDIRLSGEWIYVDRLTDERYGMVDSLSVVWDSLSYCYTMTSVHGQKEKRGLTPCPPLTVFRHWTAWHCRTVLHCRTAFKFRTASLNWIRSCGLRVQGNQFR